MSKFELVNIRSESLDTVKPSSKLNGKILKWNDEKGFGFIKPESGSEEIFFHIRSFRTGELRPRAGMQVSFELGVDREGRKQAQYVRATNYQRKSYFAVIKAFTIAAIFLAAIAMGSVVGYVPKAILWLYVVTSICLFVLYFSDKSAAKNDRWRTKESTLHGIALIGGWPGALFAQQLFRHKSKKAAFRQVFWITVVLNVSALIYLLSPYGAWLKNEINGIDVDRLIHGEPNFFESDKPHAEIFWSKDR